MYTNGSSVFSELHESLQTVLSQRLEWTGLRDVQEFTYRAVTTGDDVLVIAPTAGGKSEAAIIPVMDDILKNGRKGVSCLCIFPLKALINDQEERFFAFCVPAGLSVMKWHGDVPRGERGWKDGEAPSFLMITPESLEVLLLEKNLSKELGNLRYVIVDEIHHFVESERGVHLKILLDRLDQITGVPIQRVGLSATVGNPEEILSWLSDDRRKNRLVSVPAPLKAKQFQFVVDDDERKRIDALVRIVHGKKALVFVNSRNEAEKIVKAASGRIRNLRIHHSSLSPAIKKAAEEVFDTETGACIVCTSTLELGIDIGDLDVVVQVGLPGSVSSFLQRMGRSGRGRKSTFFAWILSDPIELLFSCAMIECAIKKEIEHLLPLKKPYSVLVQQIFLLLRRSSRASRKTIVHEMIFHPVFAGISLDAINRILSHLVAEDYLMSDGEMLMLGIRAEQTFGRSNWKDLYSVICGSGEYRVVTPDGEVVGALDAGFVNSRCGGKFTLGGRSWSMVKRDEEHNVVIAVPHEGDQTQVFWAGEKSGSSPLVCRSVQRIIARKATSLPLSMHEQEVLAGVFRHLPAGIAVGGICLQEQQTIRGTNVTVYSFYGSRFNQVLALLLKERLGGSASVRYNDFSVTVQRTGREGALDRVAEAIREIRLYTLDMVGESLPLISPELWKFGQVLPRESIREMALADYYLVEEFQKVIQTASITVIREHDGELWPAQDMPVENAVQERSHNLS
jgi:ATP-dependent Lhr-like helicase